MRYLFLIALLTTLAGCGSTSVSDELESQAKAALNSVLALQPEDVKARYPHRHPAETLAFFQLKPGSTVVEALPGGGWYSKILLPVLGTEGKLIGADYAYDMWPKFGFFDQKFLDGRKTWTQTWPEEVAAWKIPQSAPVSAVLLGSIPEHMKGSADTVLFIRALHNLARFNSDGGYLDSALQSTYDVLKAGGIVGVVQHQARENMPDDWAGGQNGYLKKSFVIARFEAAGFEFVGESDINENPADVPTSDDLVWRLPPALYTSREDPELREKMQAIGESNRMTLKFRKPN